MDDETAQALLRNHLDQAMVELRRARSDLESARAKVERIEGKAEGLRMALMDMRGFGSGGDAVMVRVPKHVRDTRRFGGGQVVMEVHPTNGPADWKNLSRAAAIVEMLRREKRAMGPSELAKALTNEGREKDEPHYVSSTLDHLKRSGRVESVGKGKWALVDAVGTPEGGGR
jgi:hypothetical protein